MLMAQLLFRLKQVAPAQAALEEAVKEDPQDPGAYIYLGEVALQSRRWTESRAMFEKGLELADNYSANNKRKNQLLVSAYSGLASMAEVQEDWTTAKKWLETMLKVEPSNALGQTRLGRVIFKLSSDREGERDAYAVFKKLHSQDQTAAYPDVNMALLYEQAGKRNNAKALMERAAKDDAKNLRTLLSVAKWAVDTGNLDMAQQNADAAIKLDPDSLDARLYVGLVARFKNDLATAERWFKEAHLQAPTHLGANSQLALVLIGQPDERKQALALSYAQLNAQLYSDLQESHGREAAVTLGWVLSRLKQHAAGRRAIEQALAAGGISADSAYHAAQVMYDAGQTENAQKILEPTLKSEAFFPTRSLAEQLLAKIQNR
jgi:tetratricopeptide (TPR) repeat protein